MTRFRTQVLSGVIAAVTVAGGLVAVPFAGPAAAAKLPKCPVNALAKATTPVEITFWHGMNRSLEDTLEVLTDQFNQSQSEVRVTLVNQIGYKETLDKVRAGLTSGDLPDVVQLEDTATQQAIDTQAFLPVQSCIKADDYDTDDFLDRVLKRYTVEKVLWPMPFNVSNPVFLYDKNAFREAGLDPEDPPTTLAQVRSAAKKIKDTGRFESGYGLKLDPWYLEQWSAKADELYVNKQNGRKARATKVAFNDKSGRQIFSWMNGMVESGLAITNSADGGSAFDNILGIRSDKVAMTIDSSATLGTISAVLASGEGGGVELGVSAMPTPTRGGKGGVLVGGAALYMVKDTSAAKKAAVWKYMKFLDEPETQATWAAGTGYVPIRESSVDLPAVQQLWATTPGYKVAYDQLLTGVDDIATQGPVIGAYQDVRDAVLAGEQEMFTEGRSPKAALKAAAKAANAAMREYNTRVGG